MKWQKQFKLIKQYFIGIPLQININLLNESI